MKDLDLTPLADVPAPRRTDAAFARSVADGLHKRRSRASWFAVPALAAAATGAFALFALVHTAHVDGADAGTSTATLASNDAAIFDDDDAFALPSLDGSTDEELARLDHALDERLHARKP
jgi:hypothetical protein